jgi:serine/threonine-protein kinase
MSAPEFSPGELIDGKYRVERVLGRGGMGVVIAAHHLDMDERVAIKFLEHQDARAADRFLREARAAARLRSPHVARVFDVGRRAGAAPYIVMECLVGEDLGERLMRDGPMDAEDVADYVLQACDALAEAHALGIVHRDLKPANMFLARGADGLDIVKVLDFGIAKLPGTGLTQTQSLLGSPAYMSPEQLESSRDVDARADIWSLGIILYQLLTGELPFRAETALQLALLVREKEPAPLEACGIAIPPAIAAVVKKCLAKEPHARYRDIASFAEALSAVASAEGKTLVPRIRRVVDEARRRSDPEITGVSESAPLTATVDARPNAGVTRPETPEVTQSSVSVVAVSNNETTRSTRRLAPRLAAGIGGAFVIALLIGVAATRSKPAAAPAVTAAATPTASSAPVVTAIATATLSAPTPSASTPSPSPAACVATEPAPPKPSAPKSKPRPTPTTTAPERNMDSILGRH